MKWFFFLIPTRSRTCGEKIYHLCRRYRVTIRPFFIPGAVFCSQSTLMSSHLNMLYYRSSTTSIPDIKCVPRVVDEWVRHQHDTIVQKTRFFAQKLKKKHKKYTEFSDFQRVSLIYLTCCFAMTIYFVHEVIWHQSFSYVKRWADIVNKTIMWAYETPYAKFGETPHKIQDSAPLLSCVQRWKSHTK